MDSPGGWHADPMSGTTDDGAIPDEVLKAKAVEPFALLISIFPLIGIVGGAVAMMRGHTRTGGLMMLIGFVSAIVMYSL